MTTKGYRRNLERTICLIAAIVGLVLILANTGDGQERPTPQALSDFSTTIKSTSAVSESVLPDVATGALLVIGISFAGSVQRKAAQCR